MKDETRQISGSPYVRSINDSQLSDINNSSGSATWIWAHSEETFLNEKENSHGISNNENSVGIWHNIKELAFIWRIFGTFPMKDINAIDGPRFQWFAWVTLYSLALLLMGVVAKALTFKENVKSLRFNNSPELDVYFHSIRNGFSLAVMTIQNIILFLGSRRLPALINQWHEVDITLRSLTPESHLNRYSWKIFISINFLSLCGELILTLTVSESHLANASQWSIGKWAMFIFAFIGDFIHIYHMYFPITWICILSNALVKGFRKVQKQYVFELQQININHQLDGEFVERFRGQYTSLCLLVKLTNDICSPIIFTMFVILFTSICANIYSSIFDISEETFTLHAMSHVALAATGAISLFILAHTAGKIKQTASKMLSALQQSPISQMSTEGQIQMLYWAATASNPLPSLTALGFFEPSPEVFITLVGVIVTYVTLLLQIRMGLITTSDG